MVNIQSFHISDKRYPMLRIVGVIFTSLGTVLMVTGGFLLAFVLYLILADTASPPSRADNETVARLASVVSHSNGLGGTIAAMWSLGLLISGMQFLVTGLFVRLAIHLEENTRASAQFLEKLCSRTEPRVENSGPTFRS